MENIKEQLANTIQAVEDGDFSALLAMGELKNLEKFVKDCIKQIEPIADDEFDMNLEGGKSIENFKGWNIQRRSGGWTWDFKKVTQWAKLESDKKLLEERYKALFEHSNCIDTDTGEVLDIQRKPRKDSFVFKRNDTIQ
jgi:hypothetical protein